MALKLVERPGLGFPHWIVDDNDGRNLGTSIASFRSKEDAEFFLFAREMVIAPLIAAAPDLLAALERYVIADGDDDESKDDLHMDAIKAIAKAKGEKPA